MQIQIFAKFGWWPICYYIGDSYGISMGFHQNPELQAPPEALEWPQRLLRSLFIIYFYCRAIASPCAAYRELQSSTFPQNSPEIPRFHQTRTLWEKLRSTIRSPTVVIDFINDLYFLVIVLTCKLRNAIFGTFPKLKKNLKWFEQMILMIQWNGKNNKNSMDPRIWDLVL